MGVCTRYKLSHKLQHTNQSTAQQDKMNFIFLAITLLGGVFGVTDEEFQVDFIML